MPIIYHCRTGNYLHKTKRIFDDYEKCLEFVKEIVYIRPPWTTQSQINASITVTKIDTEVLPEYERMFKVNDFMIPPSEPSKSEKRSNAYKKYLETQNQGTMVCAG